MMGRRIPELLALSANAFELLHGMKSSAISLDLTSHMQPFLKEDLEPETVPMKELEALVTFFGEKGKVLDEDLVTKDVEETLDPAVRNLTTIFMATLCSPEPKCEVLGNVYTCLAKMSRWLKDSGGHEVRAHCLEACEAALQVRSLVVGNSDVQTFSAKPEFVEKILHLQSCLQRCDTLLSEEERMQR